MLKHYQKHQVTVDEEINETEASLPKESISLEIKN